MAEFKEVMKKYHEMCKEYDNCLGCPFNKLTSKTHFGTCDKTVCQCPEEAEKIIMDWEKPIDWSKVKVDTKILVKDYDKEKWFPRHFAKYADGKVYTWAFGGTSWVTNEVMSWNYAKLAEGEE